MWFRACFNALLLWRYYPNQNTRTSHSWTSNFVCRSAFNNTLKWDYKTSSSKISKNFYTKLNKYNEKEKKKYFRNVNSTLTWLFIMLHQEEKLQNILPQWFESICLGRYRISTNWMGKLSILRAKMSTFL